jgi:prophage antirepressor-like protein
MNQLQVFKNSEFGEVRVQTKSDETWFCLSDLCRILEISNPSDVRKRLNQKGIDSIDTLTNGGNQSLVYVNESNLYKVIFQSRKPEAEKFTDWVTSEVLPSIRKHGMYAKDELLDNPDLMIEVITQLKKEREEKKLLQTENKLLSQETLTWTDRKVIEAIVKKVGSKIGYEAAWKEFKKEVLYSHGIALNSRITNWRNVTGKKSGPRTLDMIVDDELPACLATATAAARHHGIDISDIINKFEKSA